MQRTVNAEVVFNHTNPNGETETLTVTSDSARTVITIGDATYGIDDTRELNELISALTHHRNHRDNLRCAKLVGDVGDV